jgi:hypothetical protein
MWLCPSQDFINVLCGSAEQIGRVRSVRHKAAATYSRKPCIAQRYSILIVLPSTQPSSSRRLTNADVHGAQAEGVAAPIKPISGSLGACCAKARSGEAAAIPPAAVKKSRRRMRDPGSLIPGATYSKCGKDVYSAGRRLLLVKRPPDGAKMGLPLCPESGLGPDIVGGPFRAIKNRHGPFD